MDNRSIAAFIETKRTKMNSVIICLPSKGAGQYTTEKVDGSGEGGGRKLTIQNVNISKIIRQLIIK